jgi:hypothetical protein
MILHRMHKSFGVKLETFRKFEFLTELCFGK